MSDTAVPASRSIALERIPEPDYVSVLLETVPAGAPLDPAVWARAIFAVDHAPAWVHALFALRQRLVGLIGVERSAPDVLHVREVVGDKALVRAEERHLDFAAAIGVDADQRLVRLTTTVRLKGWRGLLYFAPVRLLHTPVTRAMVRRAAQHLATTAR